MPITKEVLLFTYEELDDDAKAKARDTVREWGPHDDWWDAVYEMAATAAEILGIDLRQKRVRLMGGGYRDEPEISFGIGDGATFEGTYSYAKGAKKRLMAEFPKEYRLHDLADRLQSIQRRNMYQLEARVYDKWDVVVTRNASNYQDPTEDAHDVVGEAMRDFAYVIYSWLEREYDYLTSDEAVVESIEANEYLFTADGEIA